MAVSNRDHGWYTYIDPFDNGTPISYFAINDANAAAMTLAESTTYPYGMFSVNRNGQTDSQAYYNGLEIQFSSHPSGPLVSSVLTFCGNGVNYSGYFLNMGFLGGGMTAAQMKAFYNLLRNYFMGIGVSVGTPPSP